MSGAWHWRCCCPGGQWWPIIVSYETGAPYSPVVFYPKVPDGFDEEVLDWATLHTDQVVACAWRHSGTAWCPSLLWCETPDWKLVLATKYPFTGWYAEEVAIEGVNLKGVPKRLLFNNEPDAEPRIWYQKASSPYLSYRADYSESSHTWSEVLLDSDEDFYLLYRRGGAMAVDGSGSPWCMPISIESSPPYRSRVKVGTYAGDLYQLYDGNYRRGTALAVSPAKVPCLALGTRVPSGADWVADITLRRRISQTNWSAHSVYSELNTILGVLGCAIDPLGRVFILWVRGIPPDPLTPKELWCSHGVIDEWDWTHDLIDTTGASVPAFGTIDPERIDDIAAQVLARDIAKQIEEELTYPGQIRITVVRESRATEIAK